MPVCPTSRCVRPRQARHRHQDAALRMVSSLAARQAPGGCSPKGRGKALFQSFGLRRPGYMHYSTISGVSDNEKLALFLVLLLNFYVTISPISKIGLFIERKENGMAETRKLYYENGACLQFCATVLSCVPTDGNFAVTLDATAFYPEGGGQRRTGSPGRCARSGCARKGRCSGAYGHSTAACGRNGPR